MKKICKYQYDPTCKSRVRDPISMSCVSTVHRLLNYCYERRVIRKYVETQLLSRKLPVDIKRDHLGIEDLQNLFSFRNSSQSKIIKHFVAVTSSEQLMNHMKGNTVYEIGEEFDLYIGRIKSQNNFPVTVLDQHQMIVLLDWSSIIFAYDHIEDSSGLIDNLIYQIVFDYFDVLYKITLTISDEDQEN